MDLTFTTAVNSPHLNSQWVYTVSFHLLSVKSLVSFCILVAFFFFLWQQSSTFTCANAISMKKCFCTKNQNFVMIFINTKHTTRSVIHGRGVVLQFDSKAFLDTRHSQYTHTIHIPKSAGCTYPPRSSVSQISTTLNTEHSGKHQ